MKKLISLILVALLAFSGIAFAEEDLSGIWYVTGMIMEGQTIDPSMLGMEMIFDLKEDGTAALSAMDQESTGTWTVSGNDVTIEIDGDSMPLTFDGASLTGEMDGVGVILEREASSSFDQPAVVYAENVSAFDGTWFPTRFGIAGMILDAETLVSFGLDASDLEALTFVIENGSVNAAGDILSFELVDGALLARIDESEDTFRIQLLEGDMIQIDMPSMPFSMYCERTEAAQQAA